MPSTHSLVISAFSFGMELVSWFFSLSLAKVHTFSIEFRSGELPSYLMIFDGCSSRNFMTLLALWKGGAILEELGRTIDVHERQQMVI
jgi:hypothetical protein